MIAAGQAKLAQQEKEKRESGPSSHAVTVRFGEGDHSFTVDFSSKSQVASLMLAYAATCHKMQGGEAPLVFVVVHGTQKRPLNREWLYTAITRASGRCVLLSTRQGLGTCLAKQSIKGKTLQEKIDSFVKLTEPNLMGAKINVRLPEPQSLIEYEGAK
jgi:ATP-dependent exoDNAse (exonuclease V) alpha subunit